MNFEVAEAIRDEHCTACRMCDGADRVCQVGDGPSHAKIMVVSKFPNSKKYEEIIDQALEEVGINPGDCFHTSAVKCLSWEYEPSRTDIKTCAQYLRAEIDLVKPKWILAFGNEALMALTGHSGIMKYRGQSIALGDATVIPTISPASVQRNPGQRQGWLGDLRYFASQVFDRAADLQPPKIAVIDSVKKLNTLRRKLEGAKLISYDVETTGEAEFLDDAAIVSLSATCILADGSMLVWALPLYHPESPFRRSWRRALQSLRKVFEACPKMVAHNGKYDARWLRTMGMPKVKVTFDTMLAAHLLDENRPKGLKVLGTSLLGVAPWGIDTRNLLTEPIGKVLRYNALDTFYTYHLYLLFKQQLAEQPALLRIFQYITMKSLDVLIQAELDGVWIDRERLATNTKVAFDMFQDYTKQLMEWVPEPGTGDWPLMGRRGKPAEVNFNPSNFARWWLFDHLGLPVIARGKDKEDGRPGDPSMAEAVMLELKPKHPVVPILLERTRWKMTTQFLTAYAENLDSRDHIHTTFKLAGTVTGRLSSGKEDEEKFNGSMKDRKGINLQQVPRDIFARGLFGAPPGYVFVEADFSQVELRVIAFIARERHMIHLYQTGQDIHRITAAQTMGVTLDKVTSDERKKAKAVNFGFAYGMSAHKFVLTAFEKYELVYSEEEAQLVRKVYFQTYPDLIAWHNRQRRLVRKYKRVQSPIGRIRRLPDIDSPNKGVQGEAERQAINSPVQSFASDMTQLSMSLIATQFQSKGIDARVVGTVHDASLFVVKENQVAEALPIIKHTMENLPMRRLFGVDVDVPIVADLKLGTWWGGAMELEAEWVWDFKKHRKLIYEKLEANGAIRS